MIYSDDLSHHRQMPKKSVIVYSNKNQYGKKHVGCMLYFFIVDDSEIKYKTYTNDKRERYKII